jgi:hypothetical protein
MILFARLVQCILSGNETARVYPLLWREYRLIWPLRRNVRAKEGKKTILMAIARSCQDAEPMPVKSQFGWHVIRLVDVRQAELPKLEDVKPQVAQQLQQQKLAKFQEDLRAKAKVE